MNRKQHGYTLTEIMIAVGVVAAMTIGGLNFYNNSVAKAQANQAFAFGKLILDDALDHFAAYGQVPLDGANYGGDYIRQHYPDYAMFVESAEWLQSYDYNLSQQYGGDVRVVLASSNIHQSLQGARIKFHYRFSSNGSHVYYAGCETSLAAGWFDGSSVAPDGDIAPLMPECTVNYAL
jgi:prepilin-type N-terminal cleavage/methylation domain-containing protein